MTTRGRPRLSAAERGLGHPHRTDRQHALATMTEGQQCFRCELRGAVHPLSRSLIGRSKDGRRYVAPLLDLDEYPGRVFGGPQIKRLSGRNCNRSHGATLGNRMRGVSANWAASRVW